MPKTSSQTSYRIYFLTSDPSFKEKVLSTLNDPQTSWGIPVTETLTKKSADVWMGVAPRRSHYTYVRGRRQYFSVTYLSHNPRIVLFDPYNYKHGVKRSGLTPDQYRQYQFDNYRLGIFPIGRFLFYLFSVFLFP